MNKNVEMKAIIFLLPILLSGCATYRWKQESGSTNFYLAHNDCQVKSKIVVGSQGEFDFGYGIRQKRFMEECMMGQGWALEKQ
jgi:hypothetical protein